MELERDNHAGTEVIMEGEGETLWSSHSPPAPGEMVS